MRFGNNAHICFINFTFNIDRGVLSSFWSLAHLPLDYHHSDDPCEQKITMDKQIKRDSEARQFGRYLSFVFSSNSPKSSQLNSV